MKVYALLVGMGSTMSETYNSSTVARRDFVVILPAFIGATSTFFVLLVIAGNPTWITTIGWTGKRKRG